MKKLIILPLFFLLLLTSSLAVEDGLVFFLPMNEVSGNMTDTIGGYSFLRNNSIGPTGDYPVFNISGDGGPYGVNTTAGNLYHPSLFVDLDLYRKANAKSICFYMNPADINLAGGNQYAIESRNQSLGYAFRIDNGNTDVWWHGGLTVNIYPPIENEYHMICTVGVDNTATMYYGPLSGNTINTQVLATGSTELFDLSIGDTLQASGSQNMAGAIDHVKIYDKVLNITEVENFFNYGSIEAPAVIPPPYDPEYSVANLTTTNGFYEFHTFDEASTDRYNGEVGSLPLFNISNDLSIVGGVNGNATNLNSLGLESNNIASLYGQVLSVGFWLNASGQNTFMSSSSLQSAPRSLVQSQSTNIQSTDQLGSDITLNSNYTGFNNWNHYTIVFNGTHEIPYINGEIAYDITSASYRIVANDHNRLLNGNTTNSAYNFGLVSGLNTTNNILIDDFFIYNGSLSQTEIQSIMSEGFNFVSDFAPSQVEISRPVGSYTLNSTGQNILFNYSLANASPTAKYDVYLQSFTNYTIRSQTALNSFFENIKTSDIPLSGDYLVVVRSNNSIGESVSISNYTVNLCVNVWNVTYSSCINDTQIKTYIDLNTCSESYDIPLDNNTVVVCDDGLISEQELIAQELDVKQQWLYLGIVAFLVSLLLAIRFMVNEPILGIVLSILISLIGALSFAVLNESIISVIISLVGGLLVLRDALILRRG